MANEHVFDMNDAEKMVTDAHTLKDIIKIALQAEKDSIAFFVGLKELVPQKAGKERMGQIIREEMSHIKWLSDKVKEMEL
jgi:rubrerythrin